MKISNNQTQYRSNISSKLNKKTKSLQFLPKCLENIENQKTLIYNGQKIKSEYLIDIVHNMILKYYFKRENKYVINATVLKEKYGYLYNYYIQYLVENGILRMVCNYKKGVTSRVYSLNESIFKQSIKRFKNTDKVLIKKYKKKVFDSIDFVDENKSIILQEVREKLISDLFSVDIQFERSLFYLNCFKK